MRSHKKISDNTEGTNGEDGTLSAQWGPSQLCQLVVVTQISGRDSGVTNQPDEADSG